jgi:hypothetical protein
MSMPQLILGSIVSLLLPVRVMAQESFPQVQLRGVVRVEWKDSQGASVHDGFDVRMARFGANIRVRKHISIDLLADLSGGERGQQAEMLDAFIAWRPEQPAKLALQLGQMHLPIFYEVRTPTPLLDTPDPSQIATALFAGVRGRGVQLVYTPSARYALQAGIWSSLTIRDPQLTTRGDRAFLAASLRWRYQAARYALEMGGFWGRRPGFQFRDAQGNPVNVGDSERRAFYHEGGANLGRTFFIRYILLWGRDRIPTGGTTNPRYLSPTDLNSQVIYAVYTLNKLNQLVARWDSFDPDEATAGDRRQITGLFYHHYLEPTIRLTLGYEWVKEEWNEVPNDRFYAGVQVRF